MALFTKRDRLAIACIATVILVGWIVRFVLYMHEQPNELRVIRDAVKPPAVVEYPDSLMVMHIDINTADEEELEKLPMIGPVKAAAIVAYRKENGPFGTSPDIMKVPGIGEATYEKVKHAIGVTTEKISPNP